MCLLLVKSCSRLGANKSVHIFSKEFSVNTNLLSESFVMAGTLLNVAWNISLKFHTEKCHRTLLIQL